MSTLVIGTGTAGAASAALLGERGHDVIVTDDARDPIDYLPGDVDLVVPSPGVPPAHHLLVEAATLGVPVWSELELAARHWHGPMVAVTGTNGKGSVVTMVTDGLRRAGLVARAVGNIGDPMGVAVREEPTTTVLVVEASSFQLHYCHTFSPDAAAILNAGVDHLDWHPSVTDYHGSKGRIFAAQRSDAWAVVNQGDPGSAAFGRGVRGRLCSVWRDGPSTEGIGVVGRHVVATPGAPGGEGVLADLDDLGPLLSHQLDNALAVFALVLAIAPAAASAAAAAIASFPGLPHLRQVVAQLGGVTYIDDSKATNPGAAAASLMAGGPFVLVAGGRNKGLPLDPMVTAGLGRVRAVVGIGESGHQIVGLFADAGIEGEVASGMDDAVRRAARLAHEGDTVLLAPGCASFDMFSGQAARGEAFTIAVRSLPGQR